MVTLFAFFRISVSPFTVLSFILDVLVFLTLSQLIILFCNVCINFVPLLFSFPDLKFKDNPQQFTFRYDRIVGDSVKLNCELNLTNSVPWLSISWMKNGQPLEDVSYRVQNLGSEYTKGWILSMESLLLADNGQYSCKIGNGSVSLERTFNLYIKGKK